MRTKVGGDGLYVKGRGKETPNTLTWESLKRVRKLWRASKELEERRKEQKKNVSSSSNTKRRRSTNTWMRRSERDSKEKDAWELFGAVVLVTKHAQSKLGRRFLRRGYSRDQDVTLFRARLEENRGIFLLVISKNSRRHDFHPFLSPEKKWEKKKKMMMMMMMMKIVFFIPN